MDKARPPLVAGNWKMNGLKASVEELQKMIKGADRFRDSVDLLVCPPATLVASFAAAAAGSGVSVGGQDCHPNTSGAHTGDIAPEMLKDAGACAVILGHSERRIDHGETDEEVHQKVLGAWRADLVTIICVGETKQERDAGATLSRIERQLDHSIPDGFVDGLTVVAYEPVWAIGTGLTPTPADVAEVHAFIRQRLTMRSEEGTGVRILYGGSVKPSNAMELMAVKDVNGALVGGASLKADDFLGIAAAYG